MTGWVVAAETVRPVTVSRTPTRVCRETLYTLIALSGKHGVGKFAKVSLEDYPHLKQFTWRVSNSGYARTSWQSEKKQQQVSMHRFLLVHTGLLESLSSKLDGDHKNRDRLDNRRSNLRAATRQQNAFNSKKPSRKSDYIGVQFEKGLYVVTIRVDKPIFIGGFRSPKKAAQVRDALARFYHGAYAVTNFEGDEAYDLYSAMRQKRLSQKQTSIYFGVAERAEYKTSPKWRARVDHNGVRHELGQYATEEEAARAVDEALIAQGLPQMNFPNEAKPAKARNAIKIYEDYISKTRSSIYIGVDADKGGYRARIRVESPYVEHHLGNYRLEVDAAKAYDTAARFFYGLDAKTNFEGTEALSPEEIKAQRNPRRFHPNAASKYLGVSWHKRNQRWYAIWKRKHLGIFPTEEAAAKAVDEARVAAGLERVNFP